MAKKPATLPELMIGDMVMWYSPFVKSRKYHPSVVGEVIRTDGVGLALIQTATDKRLIADPEPAKPHVIFWSFVRRPGLTSKWSEHAEEAYNNC